MSNFASGNIDSVPFQTAHYDTFEHITVRLTESHLTLHVLYRTQSTSKFIDDFNIFMETVALLPYQIIILGDVSVQIDSYNLWAIIFFQHVS